MKIQSVYAKSKLLALLMGLSLTGGLAGAEIKPLRGITATASSVLKEYPAGNAVDGEIADAAGSKASRWVSVKDASAPSWLVLEWEKAAPLQGIHLYSGWGEKDPIRGFKVEYRTREGEWAAIPSAVIEGNTSTILALRFDNTVDVNTNALRLWITDSPGDQARIKEVVVWPESSEPMPPADPVAATARANAQAGIPEIYLNQSGFNLGKPKRFTAPTLPDGTPFGIHPARGGSAVFTGEINAHLGDFSAFNPEATSQQWVVRAAGKESVPFTIGLWQFERITYQRAIDFMVDSRHYVGNYQKKCTGSFGWRDDHHFAWVLRTLVPQYLSNPAAYERMPRQVNYVPPQEGLWGALEPCKENAPDVVKLIHWAADTTLTQNATHEFFKGELAYFLYAWPLLEAWLPQQNHDAVLAFVQKHWQAPGADRRYPYEQSPEHDLFALKTKLGGTKGALPPGHSVLPNLLMHEVARRDGLPGAQEYFDAAHRQVAWMIAHLDWEDPQTTKGQRMSEHITLTSLAAFLQLHPDRAPAGLHQKIRDWATIMIRRSDNLWDFRRLTDDGQWTPSGESVSMWNEPGNVLGFPAALLAAMPFIDKQDHRHRLTELVWSHLDNAFGRNPCGRHFSYDAPREIEGVEHGWYSYFEGGIGQLAGARFVLDGAPKHVHYPYHPDAGNYGWSEGWVTFNTAFNLSLAYMARADTTMSLEQQGDAVVVRLRAPLNFDASKSEPVILTVKGRQSATVTLREEAPNSPEHTGRVSLSELGTQSGDTVMCTYGYGYMATSAHLEITSTP